MNRQVKRRYDGGYSLIETLVTMVITVAVMAVVTSAVIGVIKSGAGASTRLSNLDSARAGMDALSRNLRTAVHPIQLNANCTPATPMDCNSEFEQIAGNGVVFYANIGGTDPSGVPAPTRMIYVIAADAADKSGQTAAITETQQRVTGYDATGNYLWAGGSSITPCPIGGPKVAGCQTRVVGRGISLSQLGKPLTYYDGSHNVLTASSALVATPTSTAPETVAEIDISLPIGTTANPTAGVNTTVFLPNSTLGH